MWYLLKRGLQMLVILAILSVALFGLLSSMPGNPIDLLITSNPNVKPEDVIRLKRLRGLDKPWYVQYLRWIAGYPEPARAPVILHMPPLRVDHGAREIVIDVSDYVADPNFIPSGSMITGWLDHIWPEWNKSKEGAAIKAALPERNLSQILLSVAEHSTAKQNELMRLIEKESARTLRITGLFGAHADGLKLSLSNLTTKHPYVWFVATNDYGQQKVGRIGLDDGTGQHEDLMAPISTLLVEQEDKPFTVDLKKFLVNPDDASSAHFALEQNSPGSLTGDGIYTNQFVGNGQTAVLAHITTPTGRQHFAFDIEHGVIGHEHKFNRGFLYFFAGDQNALGFSQTYKRPVYELLFGAPPVCGDGKIDPGETCDDGNRESHDSCGPNCFKASDTFLTKTDAFVSGYIVRSGRIGNTVQLMFPALLLSLLIAIPLGVFSAYRQYSPTDYVINFWPSLAFPYRCFGLAS